MMLLEEEFSILSALEKGVAIQPGEHSAVIEYLPARNPVTKGLCKVKK